MKTYFQFEFSFENGEEKTVRRLGFILPSITLEQEVESGLNDAMVDFCGDEAEGYGVHDFYGTESEGVRSMGYYSYEVSEDDVDELMSKWREFFVDFLQTDKIGAVIELPSEQTSPHDDYGILSGSTGPSSAPVVSAPEP